MCPLITLLLKKVSGGIDFIARFRASANYKHVKNETKNGCNFFTHSYARCIKYRSMILWGDPPLFHTGFKNSLEKLPPREWERMDDEEKKYYQDFIDIYGTHFIMNAYIKEFI